MKKTILPSICFAVLSTIALENKIYASTQTNNQITAPSIIKYVNVSSGSLNLRKSASSTATIITTLSKGTAVTVYSDANGWARVLANGVEGYVSSAFLSNVKPNSTSGSNSNPSATPVTKYVTVDSGSLNLRKNASSTATIITTLSKGKAVTVYSDANGWARVLANGVEGYVSSTFLSNVNPNSTSGSNSNPAVTPVTKYVNVDSGLLNLRTSASTNSSIILKIAKGTVVKVSSESGGWAKIEVYGQTGYVSSQYLSATKQNTTDTPKVQQQIIKFVSIQPGSSLNLRSSGSTNSTILDKLTNGAEVKVISESSGWTKIQVNGKEGYVCSDYLSLSKQTSDPLQSGEELTTTEYVNVSLGSSLDMFNSPSTNSSILVKLVRGLEVAVFSKSNGWTKIEAYGQIGYVYTENLSPTKPDNGSNNSENPSSTVEKYVNIIYGSSLNLRADASSSAPIISKLARGTIVTVYSEVNGWANVTANGQTGYVSSQYLSTTEPFNPNTTGGTIEKIYQSYNISLTDMVKMQMASSPQTDKKYSTFIREDALTLIDTATGIVTGTGWNVRGGAGSKYWVIGQVNNQDKLQILSKVKGTDGFDWYQINYNKTWVNASPDDVSFYVNPNNLSNRTVDSMQFLKLSVTANLNATEVNERILAGKGILQGLASTFINAGNTYGVNEVYLISHALLETNNGKSELANGVLINGKTVYNMFGIGAYDSTAVTSGAQFAYNEGWFTPEAAIIGGAKFIANGYINSGQDTLYKMRWNPYSASANGYASHQYATDIGWAFKQVDQIYNLYNLLDFYKLVLEIPQYK
ncbi:SH3 domain-containing protein [Bacillus sp. 1P10SD]|uniref:SH3 domain-containing protein n=1 Tax=Bacillus sp. 1P10SD TaxID=3132265 RepID=UPI0039A4778D